MSLASAPHYGICRIKTGCFLADGCLRFNLSPVTHVRRGGHS
jgi:hypothetical protein